MNLFQFFRRAVTGRQELESAVPIFRSDILLALKGVENKAPIHKLFEAGSDPKGKRNMRKHHFTSSVGMFRRALLIGSAALLSAAATVSASESFSLIFSVVALPSSMSF